MALPVYPRLLQTESRVAITPIWSTIVQKAVSGRTVRISEFALPLHKIEITYSLLQAITGKAEFQQLAQFFNQVAGAGGLFRFVSEYITLAAGVYSYAPVPSNTTVELICAFDNDSWTFETDAWMLWQGKTVSFTTVKS